jgi:hypothetical protein
VILNVNADITYAEAVHALAALNYEIRAAGHVAASHGLCPEHAAAIRTRCARLHTLVPLAEALVAGTDPQADLPLPNLRKEPDL